MDNQEPFEAHCPICLQKVKKYRELPADDCGQTGKCVSEYYIHTFKDNLIKIIDPHTPTDDDRKKYPQVDQKPGVSGV